jgi:hypothetical protein
METLQIIVTALATGAVAALEATTSQAIKDAYSALKALIQRKYTAVSVDVEQLQTQPASQLRRGIIAEGLQTAGAEQDMELLQRAQQLLAAIERQGPEPLQVKGVNMADIKAASVKLNDILAQGSGNVTGVEMKKVEVAGPIEISGVRALSAVSPAAVTAPKIMLLFLAANPLSTTRLQIDEEARAIGQVLRQAEHRPFDIHTHGALRIADLQDLLLRYRPQLVHFSGHGSSANAIILQDDAGHEAPVQATALRNLLRSLSHRPRCVVLNACYTEEQAVAIAEVVDCVVGMSDAITDVAARHFATAFYLALAAGETVQQAFDQGANSIELRNLPEAHLPVLLAQHVDPNTLRFFDPNA